MMTTAPRVLVTGASGMLGSHIVDQLVQEGVDVVATDLAAPAEGYGWEADGVDFREGDITEIGGLRAVSDVDRIIHVAAMLPSPDGVRAGPLFNVNVAATHRLFEEASRQGAKVVFASSGSVYGDSRPVERGKPAAAFREGEATERLDFYGLSKRVDELYADAFARRSGMSWNALRCGVLYGPRLRMGLSTRFLLSVLDAADAGRTPIVDGDPDAGLDWVDVGSAAECFVRAAIRDAPSGPLNVSTGVPTRLEDVVKALLAAADAPGEVEWAGRQPSGHFSGARYYDPSRTRERLDVGLESDLEAHLRRFVDWRRRVRDTQGSGGGS